MGTRFDQPCRRDLYVAALGLGGLLALGMTWHLTHPTRHKEPS